MSGVGNALAIVGFGALLLFFGVTVLGRTVSLPLSRVLGLAPARLRGITGELAQENAMRNPKRTAASASALMIGVGLVAFITIFASSTRASVTAVVDRAFTNPDSVIDPIYDDEDRFGRTNLFMWDAKVNGQWWRLLQGGNAAAAFGDRRGRPGLHR